jgi:hypothetical protein
MNHSQLPSVASAQLPAKYEAAKMALTECNQIDECKDWSDKAQALASYAKQSKDDEMEKTAMRIRARAVRRCGELLKEIEKAKGGDRRDQRGGKSPLVSRKAEAEKAGLSPDQAKNAIRVANVDEDDFEEQIESDYPPTITNLAAQGKQKGKPIYQQRGMTKEVFQAGMYFRGHLETYAKHTREFLPQDVVDGSTPEEREQIRQHINTIEQYNDQLIAKL